MPSSAPDPATVLAAVDALGPPGTPLTTPEVAAEFDCTQRTIYNKLETLVDEGALATKKVGARGRVWWQPAGGEDGDGGETRPSRNRLSAIVAQLPMAVGVIDPDGQFVLENDRLREIVGGDLLPSRDSGQRQEWIGTDDTGNRLPPERWPVARALCGEDVSDGIEFRLERDGETRWMNVAAVPFERGNEITGAIVIVEEITERKQTEQLRERNARLEALVDASSEAMYRMGPDWEEMLELGGGGFIEDTARPRDDWLEDYIHPDDREAVREAIHQAIESKSPFELEHRVQRADGTTGWTHSRAVPVLNDGGEIAEWFGAASDITDRKRRERELDEYRQQFRTLIENFPSGAVALVDEELRYAAFGGTPEGETELTAADLEGEHVREVLPEQIGEVVVPRYEAALDGEASAFEDTVDDSVYQFHFVPVRDDEGAVFAVTAMSQDITERKRRERALREREARYRDLFTSMSEGYCVIEKVDTPPDEPIDFRYIEANPAFEDQAGIEDVVGRRIRELVPDEPQEWFDIYERVIRTDEPVSFERELVTVGRVLECYAFPVGVEEAERVGVLFTDVTERVEREQRLAELVEQLEESNERLEQFAYAASHDMQEPLRMITSYLKLIEERYADDLDEDGIEFIEFAVDGAARMRDMIDALLEYSRVETRGKPFEPVDLDVVVDDALENLELRIDEHAATITTDPLPSVKGDHDQLRRVLQNLINNAIEYSGEEPPRIHCSAERDGSMWRISIRDEGIGIAADDRDRVFEIFQRLHSRDEHAGTGIGLAICERIVERHDGEIWVESTLGEGSTFYITLPAERRPDE